MIARDSWPFRTRRLLRRIGNVPLEWCPTDFRIAALFRRYKDEDHVGYDIAGEKVMRRDQVHEAT